MIFYIVWLTVGVGLICGANALFLPTMSDITYGYAIIGSLINFVFLFALDIVVAFAVHKLPRKLFSPYRRIFNIPKAEDKLHSLLLVRKWKDKIPELGQLCNFKKDRLSGTKSEYLYVFLEETCYAEMIHLLMGIVGFAVMFINPMRLWVYYPLQLCVFNLILNLPPILVQRYNRPKLIRIYEIRKRLDTAAAAKANVEAGTAKTAREGTIAEGDGYCNVIECCDRVVEERTKIASA